MTIFLASHALCDPFSLSWRFYFNCFVLYFYYFFITLLLVADSKSTKNRLSGSLVNLLLAFKMFLTLCPSIFNFC
jgi:hypothetical protein